MTPREHLGILAREGELLARHAAHAGLGAPVPSCPGWTVRDLLRHVGGGHRRAAARVAERRTAQVAPARDGPVRARPPSGDTDPGEWYARGLAVLLDTLGAALRAAPGPPRRTVLAAPSPLALWTRRQAHETTVHRVDAARAAGPSTAAAPPGAPAGGGDDTAGIAADFAADGIDELLCGFGPRMPALRTRPGDAEQRTTVLVDPDDAPGRWLLRIGPDGATAVRLDATEAFGAGHRPRCRATGRAGLLYLALWNRLPFPAGALHGDPAPLDLWRERARVPRT